MNDAIKFEKHLADKTFIWKRHVSNMTITLYAGVQMNKQGTNTKDVGRLESPLTKYR